MFSLVDAVLLKPMPFPHPERVVRVWEAPTPTTVNQATAFDFSEWKRLGTFFDAFSAEWRTDMTASIGGEPTRLSAKLVSADYFEVFGIKPLLGRAFEKAEDQAGAAPVIVLSHSAWQARFGGDRGILNQELVLDGERHKIVGVMPAGTFDRDDLSNPGQEPAAFWKPLVLTPAQLADGRHWLAVAARLRPGTTLGQAEQQLRAVQAVLARGFPDFKKNWSVSIEPFDARLVNNSLRQSLYAAAGAVVVVLLIACANVANLLIGKGTARMKEMAVRSALGASRGRLLRQLLAETLVLCALGTAAGVLIASYIIRTASPVPAAHDSVDGRTGDRLPSLRLRGGCGDRGHAARRTGAVIAGDGRIARDDAEPGVTRIFRHTRAPAPADRRGRNGPVAGPPLRCAAPVEESAQPPARRHWRARRSRRHAVDRSSRRRLSDAGIGRHLLPIGAGAHRSASRSRPRLAGRRRAARRRRRRTSPVAREGRAGAGQIQARRARLFQHAGDSRHRRPGVHAGRSAEARPPSRSSARSWRGRWPTGSASPIQSARW